MKVFTIFIISLIFIGYAQAEKKMLSLHPVESKVLTSKQESLIRKQIILIASKQTKFQIVLGEILVKEKPANLFSVKVSVVKDKQGKYIVETVLMDEKNEFVISKIKRENIKPFELMRSTEVALELLFEKYENNDEKNKKEKSKIKNNKSVTSLSKKRNKNVQFVNSKILDQRQIDFKKRIRELQKSVSIGEKNAKNEFVRKKSS